MQQVKVQQKTELVGTLLSCTATVVAAYVGQRREISLEDIGQSIETVYGAFATQAYSVPTERPIIGDNLEEVVRDSVKQDYIICLEDGKKLKMLKRYLKTNYNMTPEEYRRKWGLPADYPMVAPQYAKVRSRLARDIGLGRVGDKSRISSRNKPKPAVIEDLIIQPLDLDGIDRTPNLFEREMAE